MKTSNLAVLALVSTLIAGCAGMSAPTGPVDIKAETPNLGIEASKKLPLKLAVVVPDPMGYTMMYYGVKYNPETKKGYSRDMTGAFQSGGYFLERELSKVASETFSQAFAQVVVQRDLPQPGQYDAAVQLNISKITFNEKVKVSGESSDVTTEWTLALYDGKNIEILNKKGAAPVHNFSWSVMSPARDHIVAMGPITSQTITYLVKEWAELLYGFEPLRAQAKR